eukprot:gene2223-1626_t
MSKDLVLRSTGDTSIQPRSPASFWCPHVVFVGRAGDVVGGGGDAVHVGRGAGGEISRLRSEEGPGAGLPPTPSAPPREATPSKRVPQSDAQSLPPAATEDAMTASQSSFSGSARHNSLALDVERKEVELALLKLFNLLKDKCSFCNLLLLSKPTLAAITSMHDVDAALIANLLDWSSGKHARHYLVECLQKSHL